MVHRAVTRIGVALLLVSGMLFYVQGILIPYQEKDATSHNQPRGNLSDLYPRWLGARELLLHGRDPYSPEITREIQAGYLWKTAGSRPPRRTLRPTGFCVSGLRRVPASPDRRLAVSCRPNGILLVPAGPYNDKRCTLADAHELATREIDSGGADLTDTWKLCGYPGSQTSTVDVAGQWPDCLVCCAAVARISIPGRSVDGVRHDKAATRYSHCRMVFDLGIVKLEKSFAIRGRVRSHVSAFSCCFPMAPSGMDRALSRRCRGLSFVHGRRWLCPGYAHHSGAGKTARGVDSAGHRISMLEVAEGVATSIGICLDHSARAHGHRRRYSDDGAVQPRLVTSWNHDPGAAIAPVVEEQPREPRHSTRVYSNHCLAVGGSHHVDGLFGIRFAGPDPAVVGASSLFDAVHSVGCPGASADFQVEG